MDLAAPFVSFHLSTNRPGNLVALLDNLERKTHDPRQIELLIKIDDEDAELGRLVSDQASIRPFSIRFFSGPRGRGFRDVWKGYNHLLPMTSQSVYFICLINDELRINQEKWDENLKKYIGLFPDHIFRLRTTQFKLRNYFDLWEPGYAPDSYAFFTKRWFDVTGDWNPASGPDTCQQFIAYHLARATMPGMRQFNRDVPIFDVSFAGEGSNVGLTEEQHRQRNSLHFRQWFILLSHRVQTELFRRARLLQATILRDEMGPETLEITDDSTRRAVNLIEIGTRRMRVILPYRIGKLRHALANLKRMLHFQYYGGGGYAGWVAFPFSMIEFAAVYFPWLGPRLRWLRESRFYFITKEIMSMLTWSLKQRQPGLFRLLVDDFGDRNPAWDRVHPIAARVTRALLRINPY